MAPGHSGPPLRRKRPALFGALFALLAQEMGKKQPAQPTTAQHATGDQETRNVMILAAALLVLLISLVFVLFPAPLAQEMGKKQTAQPTTAQHATGDQETRDAMILAAALLVLLLVLFLALFLTSLTQEMGEKQPAQASTT
jgi:ABC-type Fe3+ transport system permease subunit